MLNMPAIKLANIDTLYLDPKNPRLGRHQIEKEHDQESLLELMEDWSLDEIAVSFLENGFWPQEALIVVKEKLPGLKQPVFVVVEGNRRLAALKKLQKVIAGKAVSSKWKEYLGSVKVKELPNLADIPFIEMPDRQSVQSYLGYRHVTGIKEWTPAEKAQFIAHLIETEDLNYDQVRRKIGSKAPTVCQHYVAYRLLLQMEEEANNIEVSKVEERFSVLYRSIRTAGVQQYLAIDLKAGPKKSKQPVPTTHIQQLAKLTLWLFGTEKTMPVLGDSRNVDEFCKVLESEQGIAYLERTQKPTFEGAKRASGISQDEIAEKIEDAAYSLEDCLAVVHQYKNEPNPRLQQAIRRLGRDTTQLLSIFQKINKELLAEKN